MPDLTGDVTTSAGAVATTIANNAVTLAKMAGLDRGHIIYGDSSGNPASLANSTTDGHVLTVTNSSGDFGWEAATSGDLTGITAGTGITGSSLTGPVPTITLDLTELSANTDTLVAADQFVIIEGGDQGKMACSEINLGVFHNDQSWTSNTGTTTASNSQTFTNKAGNNSQWTNDANYITSAGAGVTSIIAGNGIDVDSATGAVTVSGENANTSNKGIVELANGSETNTGTDQIRAVTPDGLNDWTGGAGAITKLGTIASGTWSGTALVAGKVPAISALTGYTAAAYANASSVGGSSIVTVGTIGTGVWQGTTIKTAYIGDDQVTEDKLANTLLAEIDANTAKNTNVGSTGLYAAGTTSGPVLTFDGSATVTIPKATANFSGVIVTGPQDLPGNFTVTGDLVVDGDFTVSGSNTVVLAEELKVEDNIIVLNSNWPNSTPTQDAGITIERGNLTDESFFWDESVDEWCIGHTESSNVFTVAATVSTAKQQTYDSNQINAHGAFAIGSFQIDGNNIYMRVS